MVKPGKPYNDDEPEQVDPDDQSPYPSIIVNRGAFPESWLFWYRWRKAKRV